jgi:hypothetical protein
MKFRGSDEGIWVIEWIASWIGSAFEKIFPEFLPGLSKDFD